MTDDGVHSLQLEERDGARSSALVHQENEGLHKLMLNPVPGGRCEDLHTLFSSAVGEGFQDLHQTMLDSVLGKNREELDVLHHEKLVNSVLGHNLEDHYQVLHLGKTPLNPVLGEKLEDLHQVLYHGKTPLNPVLGKKIERHPELECQRSAEQCAATNLVQGENLDVDIQKKHDLLDELGEERHIRSHLHQLLRHLRLTENRA